MSLRIVDLGVDHVGLPGVDFMSNMVSLNQYIVSYSYIIYKRNKNTHIYS